MVRRFFGDNWLELILQPLTLYVGRLIWFAFAATKGQTPAKQLIGVYIDNYDAGGVARPLRAAGRPDRRLQELELLRSRGLITGEEYQAKRSEVLSRI